MLFADAGVERRRHDGEALFREAESVRGLPEEVRGPCDVVPSTEIAARRRPTLEGVDNIAGGGDILAEGAGRVPPDACGGRERGEVRCGLDPPTEVPEREGLARKLFPSGLVRWRCPGELALEPRVALVAGLDLLVPLPRC